MPNFRRYVTAAFAAAATAAAILAAPTAVAQPNDEPHQDDTALPQCVDTGGAAALGGSTTECATPGNVQIDTTPAEEGWGNMWGGDGYFFP